MIKLNHLLPRLRTGKIRLRSSDGRNRCRSLRKQTQQLPQQLRITRWQVALRLILSKKNKRRRLNKCLLLHLALTRKKMAK
jgi:hypothetical protein